jgi:hypothetical protein
MTGKAQERVSVPSLTPTPLALQGLVAVFFTSYRKNEFLFMNSAIDNSQR